MKAETFFDCCSSMRSCDMRCISFHSPSALAAWAACFRISLMSSGSASYFLRLNITSQKLLDMW